MAVETRLSFKVNDKATSSIKRISSAMSSLSSKMLKVTVGLGAIAGIGGIGSLAFLGKRALEVGDKLDKLTIRFNDSTEALSEYRFVASQAGVDFDQLMKSFNKMDTAITDASRGIGKGAWALDQLGLSAKELMQITKSQAFEQIATAMDRLDPNRRGAVAASIFGVERGRAALTLMQGGASALQAKRGEAAGAGYSLSRQDVAGIASFNDAIDKLQGIVQNIVTHFVAKLAPAMQTIVAKINNMITNAGIFQPGKFEYLIYLIEELVKRVIPDIATNIVRHMQNFAVAASSQLNVLSKISSGINSFLNASNITIWGGAMSFMEGYNKGGGMKLPENFSMLQGLTDLTGVKSFSEWSSGKTFGSPAPVSNIPKGIGGKKSFMDGFRSQIEDLQKKWVDMYGTVEKKGIAVADMTAQAMGRSFETFFFDILEGRVKKLSEVFNEFFKSIASSIAKILSNRLAVGLIGGAAGLFSGGSVASTAGTGGAGNPLYVPTSGATGTPGMRGKATTVEVVNQSGTPVRGKTAYTREDTGGVVIGIVLDAVMNNKNNSRDMLRGALA